VHVSDCNIRHLVREKNRVINENSSIINSYLEYECRQKIYLKILQKPRVSAGFL